MDDEQLNRQLCDRIYSAVFKWFDSNREEDIKYLVEKESYGRTITWIGPVIGDLIRNAKFEVYIVDLPDFSFQSKHCLLGLCLTFEDGILSEEERKTPFKGDVLSVINGYNTKLPERCIVYNEETNKIEIHREFYFYPGCSPSEQEITKILDGFMTDQDLDDIAELIETGGWLFPDLYIKPRNPVVISIGAEPPQFEENNN